MMKALRIFDRLRYRRKLRPMRRSSLFARFLAVHVAIASDTRGVVAVETAMLVSGIGLPLLFGLRAVAPIFAHWIGDLSAQLDAAHAALAALQSCGG